MTENLAAARTQTQKVAQAVDELRQAEAERRGRGHGAAQGGVEACGNIHRMLSNRIWLCTPGTWL